MADSTPDERFRHRNEEQPQPEVEGHRFRHGPAEEPSEAGRYAARNEGEDEGPDVEGHRFRH